MMGREIKKRKMEKGQKKILPLFQNIRHSSFTKIYFNYKYLSNTITKNYTVRFVLKNTINYK